MSRVEWQGENILVTPNELILGGSSEFGDGLPCFRRHGPYGIKALADDFSKFGRVGYFGGFWRSGKQFDSFDDLVVEVQKVNAPLLVRLKADLDNRRDFIWIYVATFEIVAIDALKDLLGDISRRRPVGTFRTHLCPRS